MKHTDATASPRRITGFRVLCVLLGLLFVTAASLKAIELSTEPVAGTGLLHTRWFLISLVEFEFLFGLWLLLGVCGSRTWGVAVLCFAAFLSVSLFKALSGDVSCGCFGKASVDPRYMVVIDAVVLALLFVWRPDAEESASSSSRTRSTVGRAAVIGIWLAVGVPAGWAMASYNVSTVAENAKVPEDAALVVLEPETWIGQRLPLLESIDIGNQLAQGRWSVVLYHNECAKCRVLLHEVEDFARQHPEGLNGRQIAFIEVPDDGVHSQQLVSSSSPCVQGRLDDGREWFVTTPVELELEDATVLEVVGSEDVETVGASFDIPSETDERLGSSAPTALDGIRKVESIGEDGFPDYRKARREQLLRSVACGPLALIAVLETLDVPLTQKDKSEIMASVGTKGTNLLELKRLAEARGLHCLGVETPLAALRKIGCPAIAHLNGGTFVAVTAFSKHEIEVVYPLAQPVWIRDERLSERFGERGRALVISKKSLAQWQRTVASSGQAQREGPVVGLSGSVLAVGLTHSEQWETTLEVRNDGTEVLQIKDVKVSAPAWRQALNGSVWSRTTQ